MKQLTVVYESGHQDKLWCSSAETSSDFLRLYGEPDAPADPSSLVSTRDFYEQDRSTDPPLLGQFRLKGDGAITGWYFADVVTEMPPIAASPPGTPDLPLSEMPIEALLLSPRTYNCLRRRQIRTIGQVRQLSDDELLEQVNFGPKSLAELTTALADYEEGSWTASSSPEFKYPPSPTQGTYSKRGAVATGYDLTRANP